MQLKIELTLKDEQIRPLERLIERLESVKDDLREDWDHWRKQAQQATALLTHQQEQAEAKKIAVESSVWKKTITSLIKKLY